VKVTIRAVAELAVYETYEDIFQRKSTLAELIGDLSLFSESSVLWVCASIVTGVQLWDSIDAEPEVYAQFLRVFFDDEIRFRLVAGYWSSPRRILFHRRQVLLISKLALLHCPGYGLDARLSGRRFGPVLLKANDQFDYGLLPRTGATFEAREDYARLITEMIAVEESSSPTVSHLMTRNHLMLTRFADDLRADPRFVDIAGEYQRHTRLSITELEGLVFSVHARFGKGLVRQAYKDPGVLPLKESNFSATAIPYEKVRRFLDSVSNWPSEMSDELRQRDEGPNDVTIFRMFPMIRQYYNLHLTTAWFGLLMMDNRFLLEKGLTGPYWHASKVAGGKLRVFWGVVFERYVNELLAQSCAGTAAKFIPDPRPVEDPAKQICDGIVVSGDSVVLLEYKSSMFRADTKYRGDHQVLAGEIENKLVRDQDAHQRKGVEQLAGAIKGLFGKTGRVTPSGLETSGVRTVYPYLVTLDTVGGTLGMSAFLNTYLKEYLNRNSFEAEIRPLFCSSIAELEDKSGYFAARTLPQILEMWFGFDPSLLAPLGTVHVPPQDWRGNGWLAKEWDSIFREMTAVLYPGIDPGPGMAEAMRRRRKSAGL